MNPFIYIMIIVAMLVFVFYRTIQSNWYMYFIVKRGILVPNCLWWNLSDYLLKDASAIDLYYNLKKRYGSFFKINFAGQIIHVATNPRHIKFILENSPDLFGVGQLKY